MAAEVSMTPARWARARGLVARAAGLAAGDRHAFLRQECGEDQELCRQVLVLLEANDFDETPAQAVTPPPPGETQTLGAGDHVGPYVIDHLEGAGGMGHVYKAQDPRLGRDVALKLLPPEFAEDAARLRRFEREARAASSLNHPNIVTIYDVGAHGAQPYIAMEFVTGLTLRERLESVGSLSEDKLLDLAVPIAEGLAQAHAAGIVHRDLKPENIMITPDGRVKVLDFGIAKLGAAPAEHSLDSRPDPRRAGTKGVLGTVGYMSPEQASGEAVDFRSDQFSLGAILYEMAAGRRAFAGRTPFETLMAIHTTDPPPLPGTLVPGSLGAIVARLLRKKPNARFARTKDLVEALRGLQRRGGWKKTPARFARLGFVAVALTGLSIAGLRMQQRERAPAAAAEPISSVAVMPFANDTGDSAADYLSEGITDNVIAHLSEIPTLKVMARSTVFRFKGLNPDPREIGRTLSVRAVVLGRISRHGASYAAHTEVVDAESGVRLWGGDLEREARDLARLQADIAREISKNLRLVLSAPAHLSAERGEGGDPEAYRLVLQGRYFWNRRTRDDLARALKLFEEAARRYPGYAPAYAGIADVRVLQAWYGVDPVRVALPVARTAALRAIELDPNLMEPRCALAYVLLYHDWDFAGADREFARALELNPRHPRPHHWNAYNLGVRGKFAEALAELNVALDLDPLNLAVHSSLSTFYNMSGQHDRALSQARRALDIEPTFFGAYLVMAWTYEDMKRYPESLAAYEDAIRFGANASSLQVERVRLLAELGRMDEARKLMTSLEGPQAPFVPSLTLAASYLALGDRDKALALIRKAVDDRDIDALTLKRNTLLRGLANDQRFQAILRDVGPKA